jgi:Family of unknown function (DUF5343)
MLTFARKGVLKVTTGQPKSYPRLPANIWWGLRDEFKRSVSRVVNVSYLSAKFDWSERSAANIPPNLRALGLIDEAGRPTELAHAWRDDSTYKEACAQILDRVFPDALTAFPVADPDQAELQRWFAARTLSGDSAALQMARFFKLLASGEIAPKTTDSDGQQKSGSSSSGGRSTMILNPAGGTGRNSAANRKNNAVARNDSHSPSLHIDVQIHLAADAPDGQIEALFRNMAKYIYREPIDG